MQIQKHRQDTFLLPLKSDFGLVIFIFIMKVKRQKIVTKNGQIKKLLENIPKILIIPIMILLMKCGQTKQYQQVLQSIGTTEIVNILLNQIYMKLLIIQRMRIIFVSMELIRSIFMKILGNTINTFLAGLIGSKFSPQILRENGQNLEKLAGFQIMVNGLGIMYKMKIQNII